MDIAKKRKVNRNGVVYPVDLPATATVSEDDLLQPLTHEQLSQIVIAASLRNPDVLDSVRSIAGQDVWSRRIYVGNVHPEMTKEKLLAHFSSYGEVEEKPIGFDKRGKTGKFSGFAFIVYKANQVHCRLAVIKKRNPSSATAAQFQGSGDGVSAYAGNYGGSGDGVSAYAGNYGGSRLPGGISGYGSVRQRPPLEHLSDHVNRGSYGGGTNGGQTPSSQGGGSGGSQFGGLGSSYGGTRSDGWAALGSGFGGSSHGSSGCTDQTQQQLKKYEWNPYD